jgi:hypothetical protein
MAQAHCSSCCNQGPRTFSGVTAFDRHRKSGKCLDPAKMTNDEGDLLLELRTSGPHPIWAFPGDVDFNERFGRTKS